MSISRSASNCGMFITSLQKSTKVDLVDVNVLWAQEMIEQDLLLSIM